MIEGARAVALAAAVGLALASACSSGSEDDGAHARRPPPRVDDRIDPSSLPSPDMPTNANRTSAADSVTADGVDGERLAPLVPATLGGVARTQQLIQAFAASGAYQLEGGEYANLDIQSSFPSLTGAVLHGDPCFGHTVEIANHSGCVTASSGRYSVRWRLPDRLAVVLAAPDEATVRRMAADIDFDALERLAASDR